MKKSLPVWAIVSLFVCMAFLLSSCGLSPYQEPTPAPTTVAAIISGGYVLPNPAAVKKAEWVEEGKKYIPVDRDETITIREGDTSYTITLDSVTMPDTGVNAWFKLNGGQVSSVDCRRNVPEGYDCREKLRPIKAKIGFLLGFDGLAYLVIPETLSYTR